ncbi:MAG TPA: glycosyltransferase family 39 protein [Candidatus Brocadiia bacterium]|nr:glycosyltransferase family 39 protein [Candidatus Brocadiia bacterium]
MKPAFLKQHRGLLALLLAFLAVRLVLIATWQSHADEDDSAVGIMAIHVLKGHPHWAGYYGQAYANGETVMAWLAAPWMAAIGIGVPGLRLGAVTISCATLILVFVLARREFGEKVALASAALFAFATPLAEWHAKSRGGYVAMLFSITLLYLLLFRTVFHDRRHPRDYAALGAVAALTFWIQALALPHVACVVLILLADAFSRRSFPGFAWFAAGALVGLLPLALGPELPHQSRGVAEVIRQNLDLAALASPHDMIAVFTRKLPAFFMPQNADAIAASIPATARLECRKVLLLAAYLAWRERKGLLGLASSFALRCGVSESSSPRAVLIFALAFPLFAFVLGGRRAATARYLLPIFPAAAICCALAVADLAGWRDSDSPRPGLSAGRLIGIAFLSTLLALGVFSNLSMIGRNRVCEGVQTTPASGFTDVMSGGIHTTTVVRFLLAQNVTRVLAGNFLCSRLVFESGERIIAAPPAHLSRVSGYDQQVQDADRIGLIFHERDFWSRVFIEWCGRDKAMQIGPYTVILLSEEQTQEFLEIRGSGRIIHLADGY